MQWFFPQALKFFRFCQRPSAIFYGYDRRSPGFAGGPAGLNAGRAWRFQKYTDSKSFYHQSTQPAPSAPGAKGSGKASDASISARMAAERSSTVPGP